MRLDYSSTVEWGTTNEFVHGNKIEKVDVCNQVSKKSARLWTEAHNSLLTTLQPSNYKIRRSAEWWPITNAENSLQQFNEFLFRRRHMHPMKVVDYSGHRGVVKPYGDDLCFF
jgi:hypothetical protein